MHLKPTNLVSKNTQVGNIDRNIDRNIDFLLFLIETFTHKKKPLR